MDRLLILKQPVQLFSIRKLLILGAIDLIGLGFPFLTLRYYIWELFGQMKRGELIGVGIQKKVGHLITWLTFAIYLACSD